MIRFLSKKIRLIFSCRTKFPVARHILFSWTQITRLFNTLPNKWKRNENPTTHVSLYARRHNQKENKIARLQRDYTFYKRTLGRLRTYDTLTYTARHTWPPVDAEGRLDSIICALFVVLCLFVLTEYIFFVAVVVIYIWWCFNLVIIFCCFIYIFILEVRTFQLVADS